MDEFHRVGAETWETKTLELLKNNSDAKVLGTTATPIRYLDNARDMGEEIFDNHYAIRYVLKDALEKKILKEPKYIPVLYECDEELKAYIRNKYKNSKNYRKRVDDILKRYIENSDGIEEILRTTLPNANGKYIIFCKDYKHILTMNLKFKTWMKHINSNIHVYNSYSAKSDRDIEIEKFIDDIDKTALKLLFTINRLNEGFHLSDIDGAFLLRPTTSPIIYFQQIGRVISAGAKKEAVIYDFVNNYRSIRTTLSNLNHKDDSIALNINGYERTANLIEGYDELINFRIFKDAQELSDILDSFDIGIREEKWLKNYELLKQFKERYGRLPKNKDVYKGINIGNWCNYNISLFRLGKLSNEKIQMLKEVGFRFQTKEEKLYAIWIHHYELLKEFLEIFNRYPKSREKYKDIAIRSWMEKNQQLYKNGKLSKDKINLLQKLPIPFPFITIQNRDIWNENYEAVKEYVKVHGELPKNIKIYKGKQVAKWCHVQRHKAKNMKLSKEQRKKLLKLDSNFFERRT